MKLRRYESKDCKEVIQLFYNTVHHVNARDYTLAQLDAWAPENIDILKWQNSLSAHYTMICEMQGEIVGFGDVDLSIGSKETGYLDRLYVHKDYQRRGVATQLVEALENYAKKEQVEILFTDASITARPFFEGLGYEVVQEQRVERSGQVLTNFKMKKKIDDYQK